MNYKIAATKNMFILDKKALKMSLPTSVDQLTDFGIYNFPIGTMGIHNYFFAVKSTPSLMFKTPTSTANQRMAEYFFTANSNDPEISKIRKSFFPKLEEMGAKVTNLKTTLDAIQLMLQIYKLQHLRLLSHFETSIPQSRFIVHLEKRGFFKLENVYRPTIIQETIAGETLYNMFNHDEGFVLDQWKSSFPEIGSQLRPYLDHPDDVDFNIQNFIYNPMQKQLYYIDNKLALTIDQERNKHNADVIRRWFL